MYRTQTRDSKKFLDDNIEFNGTVSSTLLRSNRQILSYAYGITSEVDDKTNSTDQTLKRCTYGWKKCYNWQNVKAIRPAGDRVDSSSSEKTFGLPNDNNLISSVKQTNGATPRVEQNLNYPESSDNGWRPDEWPSLGVLTHVKKMSGFGVGSSSSIKTSNLSKSNNLVSVVTQDLEILQLNSKALEGDTSQDSFTTPNKPSPEIVAMPQAIGAADECLRLLRNENIPYVDNGITLGNDHVSHERINNGVPPFDTTLQLKTVFDESRGMCSDDNSDAKVVKRTITTCSIKSTIRPYNESTCAFEMSNYVSNYKITQAVNKVFTKIFDGDEGAQQEDLIYKHLWLKAEAKKCAEELSVHVCRMKNEIEKCFSSNKDATSTPALIYRDLWRNAHLENKVTKRKRHESGGVPENVDDDGNGGSHDIDVVFSGKSSHGDDNKDLLDTRDKPNNEICCTTSEHSSHWSDNSSSDWELVSKDDYS